MAQKVREVARGLSPKRPGWKVNINQTERLASLIGGGILLLGGLASRSFFGKLLALTGGYLTYRGTTRRCHVYEALDIDRSESANPRPLRAKRTITINKSAEELYNFWRNLHNLPSFMKHLEAVEMLENGRSHWIADVPIGPKVEWDAEIVEERPNEMISWRALPGSAIDTSGTVRFQPASRGRGTEVHVTFEYRLPEDAAGDIFNRFSTEFTAEMIENELRRFKQLMETGEIATTEGQPSGREKDRHRTGRRVKEETERWHPDEDDKVTEASWESYPASDAPAWTGSMPGGESDL